MPATADTFRYPVRWLGSGVREALGLQVLPLQQLAMITGEGSFKRSISSRMRSFLFLPVLYFYHTWTEAIHSNGFTLNCLLTFHFCIVVKQGRISRVLMHLFHTLN